MTSRKNIKFFDLNGVNVAKHWRGEVFAISDCLVLNVFLGYFTIAVKMHSESHWANLFKAI